MTRETRRCVRCGETTWESVRHWWRHGSLRHVLMSLRHLADASWLAGDRERETGAEGRGQRQSGSERRRHQLRARRARGLASGSATCQVCDLEQVRQRLWRPSQVPSRPLCWCCRSSVSFSGFAATSLQRRADGWLWKPGLVSGWDQGQGCRRRPIRLGSPGASPVPSLG